METTNAITFGAFRLDPCAAMLWKGSARVHLQPRPLAVLSYLAARPGTVVSRDELIATLWAGTFVTKAVLKVAVRAIREALDDDADAPRYVETVGREGYRFIGDGGAAARPRLAVPAPTAEAAMVGRGPELAVLRDAFAHASDGSRRIVFVTGEAGIGKTTLIDRFVDDLEREGSAWIARGQCLEQYGKGEAYLPVLEAIGRLARDDGAPELADVLRRHAPTWVRQLPALETRRTTAVGKREAIVPTPARMLREMADALEVFTRRRALVLVLEDLQWSDRATIELLAYVARRRQRARLQVLGSLRPADLIIHAHPLLAIEQELRANGWCVEIPLELLSLAEVTAYVEARFAAEPAGEMRRLAARIHERTEGNALFMVNVVNDLVARGSLVRHDGRWHVAGALEELTDRIPLGLQELIGRRLQVLPPTARRVLEVASVAGDEFPVAAVAAGLHDDAETVEDICEGLALQGALIADAGIAEWPDGSMTGCYRFRHALYRRVLYDGIGAARRTRLHRVIGLRQEAAFGARRAERAAELAMHFARGRDPGRALEYHELAGGAALDRQAAHEAASHFTAALDALAHEPEGRERAARELGLQLALGNALIMARGYGAPEVERAFERAHALSRQASPGPHLVPLLRGLVSFHQVRGQGPKAREVGEELLALCAQSDDQVARTQAHYAHGVTLYNLAALDAAQPHLEQALALYEPETHATHVSVYGGYDPGVGCRCWLAWMQWLQGFPDRALATAGDGLALAQRLGHAFTLNWAHLAAAVVRLYRGEPTAAQEHLERAAAIGHQEGFAFQLALGASFEGWALLMQGQPDDALARFRAGLEGHRVTGAGVGRPGLLSFLAYATAMTGRIDDGLACIDEGIEDAERTHQPLYLVFLHQARGDLLGWRGDDPAVAEASYRLALEQARELGTPALELRAATGLARLWMAQGRTAEARALLAPLIDAFREGLELPDLRDARAVLGT